MTENDFSYNVLSDKHINTMAETGKISDILNAGLESILDIPDIHGASLFLLDKDTFEFIHSLTKPENENSHFEEIFGFLIDSGVIGETLTEKKTGFFPTGDNINYEFYYFAIPLITSNGPVGIVIAKSCRKPASYCGDVFSYLNAIRHSFALSLENSFLRHKLVATNEEISQKVAERTLSLLESKKSLFDKIDKLQSNISTSVPHEVRTPINQILGFSDFLLKYYDSTKPEEAVEMLIDINSSAIRLKRLFENYLFHANLELAATNVIEIQNLQHKITPSAQSVIYDTIIYTAKENNRNGDIKFKLVDSPLVISEDLLKKVIEELFINAMKYSEPGSQIIVNSFIQENAYKIVISDTGKGMSMEQVQNMGAFIQFDRQINEQQGLGLGLSIVCRIVDLHNGKLDIKSELGKYTEVSVSFPIAVDFSL